jgi:hypothetical protein
MPNDAANVVNKLGSALGHLNPSSVHVTEGTGEEQGQRCREESPKDIEYPGGQMQS